MEILYAHVNGPWGRAGTTFTKESLNPSLRHHIRVGNLTLIEPEPEPEPPKHKAKKAAAALEPESEEAPNNGTAHGELQVDTGS